MYAAWVVLLPIGVLYPLLWKESFRSHSKWFTEHTKYQGNGFALAMVGMLTAVAVVDSHAATTHTKVGLATMIMVIQHVFFAVIRPHQVDEDTRNEVAWSGLPRDLWELWHKSCGYVTIFLAWANVYLGFSKIIMDYNVKGPVLYIIHVLEIGAVSAYVVAAIVLFVLQFGMQKQDLSEITQSSKDSI